MGVAIGTAKPSAEAHTGACRVGCCDGPPSPRASARLMPWSKTLCSAAFLRAVFVGASDWNIEIPAPRFRLGGGAGGIAHVGASRGADARRRCPEDASFGRLISFHFPSLGCRSLAFRTEVQSGPLNGPIIPHLTISLPGVTLHVLDRCSLNIS